jgi:gliding motility-associated-like protein
MDQFLPRWIGVLCLQFLCSATFSQMTLFGDVYIAPQNELHIASGELYFESGKIITDRGLNSGTLSFARKASWKRANHDTHVDGFIRFYDANEFTFPVGHDNVLQPIHLKDFRGSDHLDLSYNHVPHPVNLTEEGVAALSQTQFWALRNPQGSGRVILSWNVFSNIDRLLGSAPSPQKALELITIGGFNGQKWEAIESERVEETANTLVEGYVQSKKPVDFSKYTAFTLMMRNIPAIGSEKISQAITPNGDGKNDTWIIEGIEQYPKAHISVYNRWGEAVFTATNGYQNDWAGNFKNNRDILPTGPYLYLIDYENDGKIDLKGWLYISD